MRKPTLVLFALAFMAVDLCGQQSALIGTWNLAGNNYRNRNPSGIPTQNINRQAAAIAIFQPDVLLLTELDPVDAIGRIADRLRSEHGLDYRWAIIDQPQTNIDIGVLLRDRSDSSVGACGLLDTDLGKDNYRHVFWIDLKIGEFDFRLLGVHFKSGSAAWEKTDRAEQAEIVADFVEDFIDDTSLPRPERDVLVIGDYNMFPTRDPVAFDKLSANGRLRFISSERLCAGSNRRNCIGTHIRGRDEGNLLDGFAVSANHTGEYLGDVYRINLPRLMRMRLGTFRRTVADHLPIVARFWVREDDDDEALSTGCTVMNP